VTGVPEAETISHGAAPALDLIHRLASEVGPRRPCSEAEAVAADVAVAWLAERGVQARTEPFRGYSSFAHPYGLILGASLAGVLLQERRPMTGNALTLAALMAFALEGDLRVTPVSDLVARRPSANVVASVAPAGEELQRVCLAGHLDSTRSGLMFHPRVVPHLRVLFQIPAVAAAIAAARPVLRRLPGGRTARFASVAGLVYGLALLVERELRGEDVPGANDNASGCGVAAQLAAECAARPLRHTRVDLLLSGCEESGVLGAQAYVRRRHESRQRVTMINFDSVGGEAPVRYILREGMAVTRPATQRLVTLVEAIATRRPELGLIPAEDTGALTTDATVALAHGHEAITFLARDRTIPNYHWPTDTYENLAPETVARTVEAGRALLSALDLEGASEGSAGTEPKGAD
jgi:peptidase M28-like protein